LRAWERRYGLPQPTRSEHGYRLYSERDIAILLWLQQRLKNGVSIAQAVEQFSQLLDIDEAAISHSGVTAYASAIPQVAVPSAELSNIADLPLKPPATDDSRFFDAIRSPAVLRSELIEALLIGNKSQINNILNESLALYTLDTTLLTIAHAAVQAVRAQHLTDTQFNGAVIVGVKEIELRLQSLSQISVPVTTDQNTVVLVGFGSEQTEIERLVIALLLFRKNIPVISITTNSVADGRDQIAHLPESLFAADKIGLVAWYTDNPSCLTPLTEWPVMVNGQHKRLLMAWASIRPNSVLDESTKTLIPLGTTLRDIIQYIIINLPIHRVSRRHETAVPRIRAKL